MTLSPRAVEAAIEEYRGGGSCCAEDAMRSAIAAALAVDGLCLVPKEPTDAMILAGHHQIDWCRNNQATHVPEHPSQTDGDVGTTCKQDICDAWSAMLAAASTGDSTRKREG